MPGLALRTLFSPLVVDHDVNMCYLGAVKSYHVPGYRDVSIVS